VVKSLLLPGSRCGISKLGQGNNYQGFISGIEKGNPEASLVAMGSGGMEQKGWSARARGMQCYCPASLDFEEALDVFWELRLCGRTRGDAKQVTESHRITE